MPHVVGVSNIAWQIQYDPCCSSVSVQAVDTQSCIHAYVQNGERVPEKCTAPMAAMTLGREWGGCGCMHEGGTAVQEDQRYQNGEHGFALMRHNILSWHIGARGVKIGNLCIPCQVEPVLPTDIRTASACPSSIQRRWRR